MPPPSSPEASQPAPQPTPPPENAAPGPEPQPWLLQRLDALLSEPLRTASPADRVRHRILVGATCFMLPFACLYLVQAWLMHGPLVLPIIAILVNLGVLVLARRARTLTAPALLQLANLSFGFGAAIFLSPEPLSGTHAATMLLPALAVYLLGPRLGLLITLLFVGLLSVGYPLYLTHTGIPARVLTLHDLWAAHLFAGISFVGAWALGALHTTARHAAQLSLERTLKVLRESESELNSVIDSTDDVVVSLDSEGRLLTANAAARRAHRRLFGTEFQPRQLVFGAAPELLAAWRPHIEKVLQGQRLRFEESPPLLGERLVLDISLNPIHGDDGRVIGMTLFSRDITARKEAEARLGEMHRTLVDISRQAGMAEIATGVLHNVGNTLNSVNVSAALVTDQLRKSRLTSLAKAANLLREHSSDLASFLTQDPQGQKLPGYLIALSDQLQEERETLLQELRSLTESVDHMKSVVTMQQKHARAAGAVEEVAVPQLIDEALRLHAVSFERLGIRLEREYSDVPPIAVDRHKLLQILVNLLSNARHALLAQDGQDKRLTIRIRLAPEGERLLLEVADNGVGIAPENLPRIFTQGFTTKKTGHGFGLHISALAATEMKGRLTCASPGPGQGATFTLELPLRDEAAPA